ncbi:hypothetical protein PR003_g26516 [Phytophthora rubi]|uniref:Uncharacterized protein n=1 Tax=Phytophthora rubi TaxID=129364 RepID=A0A6A3HY84_9STRA|nr:hypothetical protein PR002_g25545 [Phytophthora rubi]KAE8977008.1 hypothetical protein PR001_g25250 [Phytophthora rubi]KAE9285673.1 hypothetical protein PR003_g26516 [Phytophthora rubi]
MPQWAPLGPWGPGPHWATRLVSTFSAFANYAPTLTCGVLPTAAVGCSTTAKLDQCAFDRPSADSRQLQDESPGFRLAQQYAMDPLVGNQWLPACLPAERSSEFTAPDCRDL